MRGRFLQPGVPRGVHSTQVVVAVGGGHQGTDAALSAVKRGQVWKGQRWANEEI